MLEYNYKQIKREKYLGQPEVIDTSRDLQEYIEENWEHLSAWSIRNLWDDFVIQGEVRL